MWDLIVVGGGHAGCEAAAAARRMGASVLLVTFCTNRIGEMPCNPAIGGVGKGHLVAEIDALGGIQGWLADRSGVQFRVLNTSRGPAVWGPRVQCDKARYRLLAARLIGGLGIDVIEGEVEALTTDDQRVRGVVVGGYGEARGRSVVLATGTFLGGKLFTGQEERAGGRVGEAASNGLERSLAELGGRLIRHKTGTPPRLRRSSLDYARMQVQTGDARPTPMSWRSRSVRNIESCWLTETPETIRGVILESLDRSPLFSGMIEGTGPRYCPSIEDKVVRFPHHPRHTVFVEPEGVTSEWMYVNGLSTSLPRDVQEAVVRSVPGLERAEFLQYGYAVEYAVLAPGQVSRGLQLTAVPGVYVAGQVLGTSGYEEAAGTGLVAGISAWRELREEAPLTVEREEGYLGVLVDDLVRREHVEPYRMLTSRAEHRLRLGVDSARERLMERGVSLGLVPEKVFHVEQERWRRRSATIERMEATRIGSEESEALRSSCEIAGAAGRTWADLARRTDIGPERLAERAPALRDMEEDERLITLSRIRYAGYVAKQDREIARLRRLGEVPIPQGVRFAAISGLSREVVESLERFRPRTLREAERTPGMTPAAFARIAAAVTGGSGA